MRDSDLDQGGGAPSTETTIKTTRRRPENARARRRAGALVSPLARREVVRSVARDGWLRSHYRGGNNLDRRIASRTTTPVRFGRRRSQRMSVHVGYWGDERNCYKRDQSVAVDPSPTSPQSRLCSGSRLIQLAAQAQGSGQPKMGERKLGERNRLRGFEAVRWRRACEGSARIRGRSSSLRSNAQNARSGAIQPF
jgi:hypothetical protein